MFSTNDVKFNPTIAETVGFVIAFVLGFWSVGFWTGLIAMLLTYADQRVTPEALGAELSMKIALSYIIAFVLVISLRFLFPSVAVFDELTRIGFANVIGSLIPALIKQISSLE